MEKINKKELGKRLAALRAKKGMTQEAFAKGLGCTVKHVSHVERGAASFSLDMLAEAGSLLGCTLDYLVKGGSSFPEARVPSFVLDILGSTEEGMDAEKELLLEYLDMYRKIRPVAAGKDGNDLSSENK